MKLLQSGTLAPHVVKHLGHVLAHVVEHKAANKLVNKTLASGHKVSSGFQWNIHSPFQFFWHFPWMIPLLAIGVWAGLHFSWPKIERHYNGQGRLFAPWKDQFSRVSGIMYREDKTAVFGNSQFLYNKFPNFVWQQYWRAYTFALGAWFLVMFFLPSLIAFGCVLLFIWPGYYGYKHIKYVYSVRMRTLMQMGTVAATAFKWKGGWQLNIFGWVKVSQWGNPEDPDATAEKNLLLPGATYIMYDPSTSSEEKGLRDSFERNFNGTVTDQNTWMYEWESSNNQVICKPVPFIPERTVQYPFPDRHPWNIFPVGEASGGKMAFLDIAKFPHALVAGVTGSGKATNLMSSIPTPSGWTTMGKIRVGDYVFDENGSPTRVFGISEIIQNCDLYRVRFSDGSFIDASSDHYWRTETRKSLESRWNSKRKEVERRSLISEEGIEKLKILRATLSNMDELTMEQIMRAAEISNSPWLISVSKEIGHVGEIQMKIQQHYKEQIVRQNQKVTRYPAAAAWMTLEQYNGKGHAFLSSRKDVFLSKMNGVTKNDTVSIIEIVKVAGFKNNSYASSFFKQHKVPGTVVREIVELKVPDRISEKMSRLIKSYNGHAIIDALLERIETPANDQRYKKTYSQVRTTKEIMETLKTGKLGTHLNHSIPVTKPLVLPEISLPIGSYLIGVFLGDGFSREGAFCGIDREIAEHIRNDGYILTEKTPTGDTKKKQHPDFRIWTVEGLKEILAEENLLQHSTKEGTKKHIPAQYLRASISQRRMLLAGLLDTDGNVGGGGGVEFVNTNPHIAFGVYELAISLGYRATIIEGRSKLNGVDHGRKWQVSFTCEESPFRLSRKTKTFNERYGNRNTQLTERRFITAIEKIPNAPARCIQVDSPSKMFLVGREMIPTHNSVTQRTLLLHCLQSPEWRVALIDPKRVELSSYRNHKHVVRVATELHESVEVIEEVEKEMQTRYLQMQTEGVNFFKNLKNPPPAFLLMVDEVYALLAPENIKSDEGKERDAMHARISLLIGAIARLGRAAGVHMILATQRPDAKVLSGETKMNLDARIAQGRMDSIPSNMVLDSDRATRIPDIKGRAVLRTGNDMTEFQAYFLPEEQLQGVLEMSEALSTGAIKLDFFDSLMPDEVEEVIPGRFDWLKKRPKLSFKLPSLPGGIGLKLANFMDKRAAVAEQNDARSSAAIEAAKNGSAGTKPLDRGNGNTRGSRGSRKPVEPVFDPLEEEEDFDIDAIADAARARGIRRGEGLDLRSNPTGELDEDGSRPRRGLGSPAAPRRLSRDRVGAKGSQNLPDPESLLADEDEDRLALHSFESDDRDIDEHDFEDAVENQVPVRSPRLSPLHSRRQRISEDLANENEESEESTDDEISVAEAIGEISELENSIPFPKDFPVFDLNDPSLPAPLTFDLTKLRPITLEQVLAQADKTTIPISSADLLAALQYEAALEAAGMPIPVVNIPVIKDPLDPVIVSEKNEIEDDSFETQEELTDKTPDAQYVVEDVPGVKEPIEDLPFTIPMPGDVLSSEDEAPLSELKRSNGTEVEEKGKSEVASDSSEEITHSIPMPNDVVQSRVPGIFSATFIPQIPRRPGRSPVGQSDVGESTPVPTQKALSAESAAEQQWISIPSPDANEDSEAPWMPKVVPVINDSSSPFGKK